MPIFSREQNIENLHQLVNVLEQSDTGNLFSGYQPDPKTGQDPLVQTYEHASFIPPETLHYSTDGKNLPAGYDLRNSGLADTGLETRLIWRILFPSSAWTKPVRALTQLTGVSLSAEIWTLPKPKGFLEIFPSSQTPPGLLLLPESAVPTSAGWEPLDALFFPEATFTTGSLHTYIHSLRNFRRYRKLPSLEPYHAPVDTLFNTYTGLRNYLEKYEAQRKVITMMQGRGMDIGDVAERVYEALREDDE